MISDTVLFRCAGFLAVGSFILGSLTILNIYFTKLDVEYESDTDIYIEKNKKKFNSTYNNKDANINIDPVFYDKTEYGKIIESKDNFLEKSWKQRILFENTPSGNVVMFFDAYKMGFAYYSDSNIPYHLLNAVAMKYISIYLCRDFFLDKSLIPEGECTPFQNIHEIEVKKEKKNDKFNPSKGPFAKLKTYSNDKDREQKKNTKEVSSIRDFIKNKFICKGKMRDLNLLQNIRVKDFKKELEPINYNSFKHRNNVDKTMI